MPPIIGLETVGFEIESFRSMEDYSVVILVLGMREGLEPRTLESLLSLFPNKGAPLPKLALASVSLRLLLPPPPNILFLSF